MEIENYTLCYCHADGKLHVGLGCSEFQEQFIGEITDQVVEAEWYSGDGPVLTLCGCSFATSADMALVVPDGTTILFRGENTLRVVSDRSEANVAVLYGSGDMTLEGGKTDSLEVLAQTEDTLYSRAICIRKGDLTINGGKITALAGKSRKRVGIYAGGHLYIDIGEKGVIRINGGEVTATRIIAGERMFRLHLAGNAWVKNAMEYLGGPDPWNGDSLRPIVKTLPVVVTFGKP